MWVHFSRAVLFCQPHQQLVTHSHRQFQKRHKQNHICSPHLFLDVDVLGVLVVDGGVVGGGVEVGGAGLGLRVLDLLVQLAQLAGFVLLQQLLAQQQDVAGLLHLHGGRPRGARSFHWSIISLVYRFISLSIPLVYFNGLFLWFIISLVSLFHWSIISSGACMIISSGYFIPWSFHQAISFHDHQAISFHDHQAVSFHDHFIRLFHSMIISSGYFIPWSFHQAISFHDHFIRLFHSMIIRLFHSMIISSGYFIPWSSGCFIPWSFHQAISVHDHQAISFHLHCFFVSFLLTFLSLRFIQT